MDRVRSRTGGLSLLDVVVVFAAAVPAFVITADSGRPGSRVGLPGTFEVYLTLAAAGALLTRRFPRCGVAVAAVAGGGLLRAPEIRLLVLVLVGLAVIRAAARAHWAWPAAAVTVATLVPAALVRDLGAAEAVVPASLALAAALGVLDRQRLRNVEAARREDELRTRAAEDRRLSSWHAERAELSRELHDAVGHHVTAMVVQAEAGLASPDVAPLAAQSLHAIGRAGREALGELDTVVRNLLAPEPQQEHDKSRPARSLDNLQALADPLRGQGAEVRVAVRGDTETLTDPQRHTVYRTVQEALTNAQKHAQPTWATVDVNVRADSLTVVVTHDGRRQPGPTEPDGGRGLAGARARLTRLGGHLDVSLGPGGTTALTADIPLREPTAAPVDSR